MGRRAWMSRVIFYGVCLGVEPAKGPFEVANTSASQCRIERFLRGGWRLSACQSTVVSEYGEREALFCLTAEPKPSERERVAACPGTLETWGVCSS